MKTSLLLLLILLVNITMARAQQIDAEHQKKAEWIIQEATSRGPLISLLTNGDSVVSSLRSPHEHDVFYNTKRQVNGKMIDTVEMSVFINDSSHTIDFRESYNRISKAMIGYNYRVEKGELIFAFLEIPSPIPDRPNCVSYDTNLKEYHTDLKNDTTPTIDIDYTKSITDPKQLEWQRKQDLKAVEFYEPKLLMAIDELYDRLHNR
jgi:hypothetical protein